MSERSTMPPSECDGAEVAAYALGSLDVEEARVFERHLRSCAVCPVELESLRQVVDDIARGAPPESAPRGVKRRVMREVRQDVERHRPSPASARPRGVHLGGAGIALGAGVAFAIAAIIVVVIALPGRMANRTIQATVAGSGTAALQISGDHSELVIRHLAAPPRGDIYEVWEQRGTRMLPKSLFSVDAAGNASVAVPGSLYGVSHVLVTPEPAPDGSRHPTHSAVLDAALQA